jgi:hypothetical protein
MGTGAGRGLPRRPGPSRRAVLGALTAAAGTTLAGCTSAGAPPRPRPTITPPASTPPPQPDVPLAAAVLRREQAVLDRVRATSRRHPRLAATLTGARAAHHAHVQLLRGAVPAGTSGGGLVRRTPRVPAEGIAALRALARAEGDLAASGRRSALAADSGAFARVLASMAAAAAQQATHLTAAATERADRPPADR